MSSAWSGMEFWAYGIFALKSWKFFPFRVCSNLVTSSSKKPECSSKNAVFESFLLMQHSQDYDSPQMNFFIDPDHQNFRVENSLLIHASWNLKFNTHWTNSIRNATLLIVILGSLVGRSLFTNKRFVLNLMR